MIIPQNKHLSSSATRLIIEQIVRLMDILIISMVRLYPRTRARIDARTQYDHGFNILSLIVATPCDLDVIIVYHKCLSGFVCKRNIQFIA